MELSKYVKFFPVPGDPGKTLIYSTLRSALLKGTDSLVEAIKLGAIDEKVRETLAKIGILVPDAMTEQERMRGFFVDANLRSKRFTALVALNLDCNLNCVYCYEDHFRGKKYMSTATADLMVKTFTQGPLAEGKDLLLDFYGGEALLSLPLIRQIIRPLKAAADSHEVSFNCTMVTNGTLLRPETVDELIPLGLQSIRTTIDGPPDIHDSQRPYAAGNGSFAAIIKNMKRIAGKVSIHVGGNYTCVNYLRFPELIDILAAEGLTPEHVPNIIFSPVTPKAGEAGVGDFAMGCACTGEPWLIEASLYLREEILKRGYNTPKPKLAGCVVEFENDIVVGYDGSLYKCPAFMGWPELQIGTLSDGITDYAASHKLDVWKNDECLDCAYLPLCFGGCRFLRKLRTGEIDGVDCRREYFDATLGTILWQDLTLRNPVVKP